jgi:hypothetical protein
LSDRESVRLVPGGGFPHRRRLAAHPILQAHQPHLALDGGLFPPLPHPALLLDPAILVFVERIGNISEEVARALAARLLTQRALGVVELQAQLLVPEQAD